MARFANSDWTPEEEKILILAKQAGIAWRNLDQWLPGRSVAACKVRHWQITKLREPEEGQIEAVGTRMLFDGADGSQRLLRRQLEAGQHFFQANRDEEAFAAACDLVGLRMTVKTEAIERQAAA